MHKKLLLAACASLIGFCVSSSAMAQHLNLGSTPAPAELTKFYAIPPDGRGLPPGRGTAAEGKKIFADSCAVCHGDKLQGIPQQGIGGDRLIGGRGTLTSNAPIKTVESYWPYSTTLFDYIKRAMPFNAPGSLTDDQIYAVSAYILSESNIIKPNDVMDAKSLPAVAMPNRDGFVPDPRPEIELYR
ncbi:MAG TPA: cytochrome c [Xanthobacteraceae bacterium]|jgi:cytochrome c|nr:cytochrome c [Xanthobacteraceae bacterium]